MDLVASYILTQSFDDTVAHGALWWVRKSKAASIT
jgi:hypothetical protein